LGEMDLTSGWDPQKYYVSHHLIFGKTNSFKWFSLVNLF